MVCRAFHRTIWSLANSDSDVKPLTSRIADRLADIDRDAWNRLTDSRIPYLRHEFLVALEENQCLGREVGWHPRHVLFEDADGQLVAACPAYLKTNSFGEFVFDWSWADAHQQLGRDYYPKWVIACPFTPATGPRLLLAPEWRANGVAEALLESVIQMVEASGLSSLHWLFTNDTPVLESPRLLRRLGCQFHWTNAGYASFDDFLSGMTSKRRKEILRERRQVRDAGIELRQLSGEEMLAADWATLHRLYRLTFAKHGNYPALSLKFFQSLGRTMGESVRVAFAVANGEIIAGAFYLVGAETLYGRYWGCTEEVPGLHFETCYYQGLEYCIAKGLQRFEPGAQGEHKISRGFLPTPTWSAHWIADPKLRAMIARFLDGETQAMEQRIGELHGRSPFKAVAPSE